MRCRGFTLVELMVTIAIVAILAAIAFPNFESTMRSNRVATTTNELTATLSLARMEALRSPSGAVICTSVDGSTCGGTWSDGWMVWIDSNGDGNPTGANDRILRYVQGNNRLAISATPEANATRIEFDNRGRTDNTARQLIVQPDTCPSGQQLVRRIDIALTGQVRTTRVNCT